MHMVSLALWPVAWAIGHTGTIALYDALISLIAGTSRVPDMVGILQWNSITSAAPTEAQLQTIETALSNWFMGNIAALLSILVGGLGFALWVVLVSILGPVFLHKLLVTGALFVTQAAGAVGRQAAGAGRVALNVAQVAGPGGLSLLAQGPGPGERLSGARASDAVPIMGAGYADQGHGAQASMATAAQRVDDFDGKDPFGR
jgi:hypothetical protein